MPRETLRKILVRMLDPENMPLSAVDVAEATGRNRGAVRKLLTQMHDDQEIHVAAWRRASRGPYIALFTLGPGLDAPPPEKLTNAEVCKRYRTSPHGRKVHLKASRRWYRQNNGAAMRNIGRKSAKALKRFEAEGVKAIDPLLAAIMGNSQGERNGITE